MTTDEKMPPDLKKLAAEKNIEGLIEALTYKKNYRIRQEAARVMGELQDLEFVAPLLAALQDDNSVRVRNSVVQALEKFETLPDTVDEDTFKQVLQTFQTRKKLEAQLDQLVETQEYYDPTCVCVCSS
jgi:hypothetical protein